ncbi:uncharacterized protein LOC121070273 [Cygnus olor]|uniref:uncharacterized protein LOC121070273 n=1 Tax=Cygnus olor TaxID=8869 RepID=UPI001ADEA5CC|nr:uncharacterized protein LOC121070273 [Cygnus olor]
MATGRSTHDVKHQGLAGGDSARERREKSHLQPRPCCYTGINVHHPPKKIQILEIHFRFVLEEGEKSQARSSWLPTQLFTQPPLVGGSNTMLRTESLRTQGTATDLPIHSMSCLLPWCPKPPAYSLLLLRDPTAQRYYLSLRSQNQQSAMTPDLLMSESYADHLSSVHVKLQDTSSLLTFNNTKYTGETTVLDQTAVKLRVPVIEIPLRISTFLE